MLAAYSIQWHSGILDSPSFHKGDFVLILFIYYFIFIYFLRLGGRLVAGKNGSAALQREMVAYPLQSHFWVVMYGHWEWKIRKQRQNAWRQCALLFATFLRLYFWFRSKKRKPSLNPMILATKHSWFGNLS